jgi:beta-phosphoglucomutase
MKKLTFKPRVIIFDMDGVIIDSMPYHFISWYEALRPWGVRVSCFDIYEKEGERWDKTLRFFLKREGLPASQKLLTTIFSQRKKIFKKNFKRFIFKGVEGFLRCLKRQHYCLALVSGTPSDEIAEILPPRIKRFFTCVVGGDNVKKGKPHPEPYVRAARGLGVKPSECLVIENAPLGIRSAKKAGMFCVAVTTSLPKNYLTEADIVVDTLQDIPALIEKSCAL